MTGMLLMVQAQAAEVSAGPQPVIIRNTGGGGSRDVHLENFSISNGGQELIEARPNVFFVTFGGWLRVWQCPFSNQVKPTEHVCWWGEHHAINPAAAQVLIHFIDGGQLSNACCICNELLTVAVVCLAAGRIHHAGIREALRACRAKWCAHILFVKRHLYCAPPSGSHSCHALFMWSSLMVFLGR